MKVTVKLFAAARELAGTDQLTVDLPGQATVGQLRTQVVETCPALGPLAAHAMFAVDGTYASGGTEVSAGAEVALIPPVSGG